MKKLIFFVEYIAVLLPFKLIRLLPYRLLRLLAAAAGFCAWRVPSLRKLVAANIHAALPELPEAEQHRICRKSFHHLMWNLLEFLWLAGRPDRVRHCYRLSQEIESALKAHVEKGVRIIFVNPHLGSWEASGVMAPFYAGVNMCAIAKPVHNPYFNDLLNSGSREKIGGLRIIFSRGAIRAAVKALRDGLSIGTLIDQNTRVRDGGVFVNFFGLPVPSSTAPAELKRFCDQHEIPAVIIYGTSVRHPDGFIHGHMEYLPRPFAEYPDAKAVLQELMTISERYIRNYPEQYLWLYRRFQHIPQETAPELCSRYPFYAKVPPPSFYRKLSKGPVNEN